MVGDAWNTEDSPCPACKQTPPFERADWLCSAGMGTPKGTLGVPGMCSTPTAFPDSPSSRAKQAVRYPVPDPTSSARPPGCVRTGAADGVATHGKKSWGREKAGRGKGMGRVSALGDLRRGGLPGLP